MSTRVRARRTIREGAAALYGLAALGVVVAPALILDSTATGGGVAPSWQAWDLLAVSAVLGLGYGVVCYRRLRRQSTMTRSRPNVWIGAAHALVALALLSSVLLAVVLHQLGDMQAPLAGQEWTLLALWGGVQLLAIAVAEAVERGVFRWLTSPERRAAAGHGERPVPARHYRRGP
ncbi:hypothetical protein [Blastococcus saxobsidens]|uniref:Uncharacterized protein n=1 Tax=Blastococcus saxobsidens (strain DD2) TaxID=1146883 RepID=H6RK32_BLASD|nr:hypothetical protein [Blastococcus saxobsidens]CCG04888.1 membrane protein of unknown function [Blastococcus saxobsidens DD2]